MDCDDLDRYGDLEHEMTMNDISLAPTLEVVSNPNPITPNKRARLMLAWPMKIHHAPIMTPSTNPTLTPGLRHARMNYSPSKKPGHTVRLVWRRLVLETSLDVGGYLP